MGVRWPTALASASVLLCLGCGSSSTAPAEPSGAAFEGPLPAATSPGATTPVPTFAPPARDVLRVAVAFARAVCSYATLTQTVTSFLTATEPVATKEEQGRLARSPRAHLPWRAMRDRAERANVSVTGVSEGVGGVVVVTGVQVTSTSFATVRAPVQLRVTLKDGRVGDARGDCL